MRLGSKTVAGLNPNQRFLLAVKDCAGSIPCPALAPAQRWAARALHNGEMTTSIADLRKSYERAELNEDARTPPLQQFDQWLKEAISAEVPEPNAMTLATVGSDLRPSTRIVLIKGL